MNREIIAFAFGAKCGALVFKSKCFRSRSAWPLGEKPLLVQQPRQGDGADAEGAVVEKLAAGECVH